MPVCSCTRERRWSRKADSLIHAFFLTKSCFQLRKVTPVILTRKLDSSICTAFLTESFRTLSYCMTVCYTVMQYSMTICISTTKRFGTLFVFCIYLHYCCALRKLRFPKRKYFALVFVCGWICTFLVSETKGIQIGSAFSVVRRKRRNWVLGRAVQTYSLFK